MARRRAGGGRRVANDKSPNYGAMTRGTSGVRRVLSAVAGQPGITMLKPGSNRVRGIRTLMKRDISKGVTQPEATDAMLMSQGAHIDRGGSGGMAGVTILSKEAVNPSNRGSTVVKPPNPAGKGGRIGRRIKGT